MRNSTKDPAISRALLFPAVLTFHRHVHTLAGGQLGLDQDIAGVLALVHLLLHVRELQRAVVLERHLAMVEGQQVGILVPLDGVVGVPDDPAVDVGVPPSDGRDVLHGPNARWPCQGKERSS